MSISSKAKRIRDCLISFCGNLKMVHVPYETGGPHYDQNVLMTKYINYIEIALKKKTNFTFFTFRDKIMSTKFEYLW